ncbi:MAG TPA: autotransporter [Burkholderiales bacterium]|nr:autotransporter [Burkholderiales bacterium]
MTIEGFLAAARQALAGASPQQAMRSLLDATVEALHARTSRWIEHDEDEMLLASSAQLTVYHIALSPRIHYPPHDHRVPAMIALYQGAETSFSYRRKGRALVQSKRHDHAAPCVASLPADAIHSVVNLGDVRSAAIHVYFGDLTAVERSIWDADLREERRFDNRFYFEQARKL